MRIGVDGNEANVDQRVGVSMYTWSLLNEWHKQASSDLQFTIYLSSKPRAHMPPKKEFFKYKVIKPAKLWSRIVLPAHFLFDKSIDVFFSPAHYSPAFIRVPLVVTIHDLSYHYFPKEFLKKDLYKLTRWTKQSLDKAKKIIAVSKHTKNDITKVYGTSSSDITVIYNGFDSTTSANDANLDSDKPYILYVGTLQPRKNISFLIEVFAEFKTEHSEYQLRLAGKKGWLYNDILNRAKKLGIENDVIFEGYVDDDRKNTLYKNAHCFVMPSLYEGFNIPLLEALNSGCPVVAADASCLPEVGGDACLYFEPGDKSSLLNRLQIITVDNKLRDELIADGHERVKQFSWQKSAKETLDVIRSAVKK